MAICRICLIETILKKDQEQGHKTLSSVQANYIEGFVEARLCGQAIASSLCPSHALLTVKYIQYIQMVLSKIAGSREVVETEHSPEDDKLADQALEVALQKSKKN